MQVKFWPFKSVKLQTEASWEKGLIYRCPWGRERALSPCGCDVGMLLTYYLVTIKSAKPNGVGMAALLLLCSTTEPVVGMWELLPVTVAGMWLLHRRFVPAEGGFDILQVTHEPWQGMVWGEWGGWSDSLSSPPFPAYLELAAHCCRGAEVVSWCVCVHKLVLLWDFFLETPGIQKRKRGKAATEWGFGWMGCIPDVTDLGLCCTLGRLEGGFHFCFFLFFLLFQDYKIFYWLNKRWSQNLG